MTHRKRIGPGLALGLALIWGATGCHKNQQTAAAAQTDQNPGDPADANFAPVNGAPAQALGQSYENEAQQQAQDYGPQQPAPIVRQPPEGYDNGQYDGQPGYDENYDPYASDLTSEEATEPPPPLPEYDQPPCPDPNDIWVPGYWAWGSYGYYWVPGYWAEPPYVGALWTPGYWGFVGGVYRFHHGFWARHIGFYGGIDYGNGYTGYGYYGGYWNGDHFFYNTAVNDVNRNAIHNVYDHNVVVNHQAVNGRIVNRTSFNGGHGGVQAQPKPAELAVLHEQRNAPMTSQTEVQHQAAQNRQQRFSANQGRPQVAATANRVVAGRTPPPALPQVAQPEGRGGPRQLPGQPQSQGRQGQQPENRGFQPQGQPRPGTQGQSRPEVNRGQAQPESRGAQAQPQRGSQPQRQPQAQHQQQPQARPQSQEQHQGRGPQPQARPQTQTAPAHALPEARPAPQPQARPEPTRPQAQRQQPRQQPQQRTAPQSHPQPQARPAPQQHPQPHPQSEQQRDDHPHP